MSSASTAALRLLALVWVACAVAAVPTAAAGEPGECGTPPGQPCAEARDARTDPAVVPGPDEAPAIEPGTRLARWTALRRDKARHLRPPDKGLAERTFLSIEKAERPSFFDWNYKGFYPRFQSIASGSQVAGGVRFWQPDIGASRFDVHASAFYSVNAYEFYDLQFGRIPHPAGGFPLRSTKGDDVYELGDLRATDASALILYGSLRYQHYPELTYYGLGPDSLERDEASFLHQSALYDLVAGYQFAPRVSLTGRVGYYQAFVENGRLEGVPAIGARYDDVTAPGLAAQPDFLRTSATLLFDTRELPGNPDRGLLAAVEWARWDDRGGEAYRFDRWALDLRAFVPLGSPQRLLAARVYASLDDSPDGARTPFYLQETLGGSHTLRAFPSFRFRGEKLVLLQAEYRWEAAPALELALFVDAGAISKLSGDELGGVRHDLGFAVRLKSLEAVLVRFDMAWGDEGSRALLRFSPVF